MAALAQRASPRIEEAGLRGLDPEGLVPWIAAGYEPAIRRFYDATSGLVFGLLLLILGDTEKADEVLVEVYVEVKDRAARFDKNHDSLLTWLITIAHRHALEHLFLSTGDQQFAVSIGLASPPGRSRARRFGISRPAHRRLVDAALSGLSPAERKMIELTYFSQMSSRAIANKLQESQDAVRTGLQHGILQLYHLFKNGNPAERPEDLRSEVAETQD